MSNNLLYNETEIQKFIESIDDKLKNHKFYLVKDGNFWEKWEFENIDFKSYLDSLDNLLVSYNNEYWFESGKWDYVDKLKEDLQNIFKWKNLSKASFINSNLKWLNFEWTKFENTDLRWAIFEHNQLTDEQLKQAILSDDDYKKFLEEENKKLKKETKEKDSKLESTSKEYENKLIKGFEKIKKEFHNEEITWLIITLITFFILLVLLFLPFMIKIGFFSKLNFNFNDYLLLKYNYFWLILLLLGFLYFSARQYVKAKNLRIENQNKITILQWFQAIKADPDKSYKKGRFYDKVSSIVFKWVEKENNSDLIYDKLVDIIDIVSKNIKK